MSQHDMDLANAAGAAFRADANAALVALAGLSSGATAPATTFAYMPWADTTSGWLKQRDAANAAWILRMPLGTGAAVDIASAATLDLTANAANSDTVRVTGTTTTTAITLADGQHRLLRAAAAWPITHGASLICPGSASYTCAAGDLILAIGEAAGVVRLVVWKADGTAVVKPKIAGDLVQRVEATPYTTYSTTSSNIPYDDTIPQITEGTEYLTATITPTSASNRLVIRAHMNSAPDAAGASATVALFQDSTANALAVVTRTDAVDDNLAGMDLVHEMAAGTTSATTFRIRAGSGTGILHINGRISARLFGGILACRLSVEEIKV